MALFLFFLCSCSPLAYTPTRAVNSTAELPPFKTITVLHFFSTWCSTCLPELATIETFVNHPPRPDLVVFAIALGESADTVGRFLARRALRGDHYFCDPASTLQKEFAITALPVTLVLNQDGQPLRVSDPITGRLVDRLVGAQDWEKLRAVFATMPRAEASQ